MKLEKQQVKEIAPHAYNRRVQYEEAYFRQKLIDLQGSCHKFEPSYWRDKKKTRTD